MRIRDFEPRTLSKAATPRTPVVLMALALLSGVAQAANAATHTVVGRDDANVDRENIQRAVDRASAGDVVELVGTFQLDGTSVLIDRSRLTVTGRAQDDDGDGTVNEDWVDGVDNDGDGEVDEDDWNTVVRGVARPDGSPAGDPDRGRPFNRGFVIAGVAGTLRQITVRDIKLETHHRGVSAIPELATCPSLENTGGAVHGLVVEGSWFDNCTRGVQAIGNVARLKVTNNLFTRNSEVFGDYPILVFGTEVHCGQPDGEPGPAIPVGTPKNSEISENRIEGGLAGIVTVETVLTTIRRNRVIDSSVGLALIGDEKGLAHGNEVTARIAGLVGRKTSPGTDFSGNVVETAPHGLVLDLRASGFTATGNRFVDSSIVDVLLDPTTSENTVIGTAFETTVTDLGLDNRLLGTLTKAENPGVPENVRQKLEELRRGLESRQP